MLELLMTSHGSSESCGVKQGTGCSTGLRAMTPRIQEVRGSIDPVRRKRRLGRKRGEKTRRKTKEFVLVKGK